MRKTVFLAFALLGMVDAGQTQDLQRIYINAYQKAIDAVVGIQAIRIGNPLRQETYQPTVGSGIIIDHQGLVLTNKHVVNRTRELQIILANDQRFSAQLVNEAPDNIDLAIIKINNPPANLQPIVMGDSDQLQPGEIVLAIGNPAGLSKTVTQGIVSAIGRYIVGEEHHAPHTYIQTDAAINPGNSGGALINLEGQLIGMPTLTSPRLQNVGFAIPVNVIKVLIPQLIRPSHGIGWLGINIQEITDELRSASPHPLPPDIKGVLVTSLHPQSPARGKIQSLDVITKIEEEPIDTKSAFQWAIRNRAPETDLRLTVWRPAQKTFLDVTLHVIAEPGNR